jgi:antitoxin CptB
LWLIRIVLNKPHVLGMNQMNETPLVSHQADPVKRARLRWRARRGLLENDIILTRYLDAEETSMTDEEVDAFSRLMDLTDNDLMDLLLSRKEPNAEVDMPHIHALLKKIRSV